MFHHYQTYEGVDDYEAVIGYAKGNGTEIHLHLSIARDPKAAAFLTVTPNVVRNGVVHPGNAHEIALSGEDARRIIQ
jgi:hypothetical protein